MFDRNLLHRHQRACCTLVALSDAVRKSHGGFADIVVLLIHLDRRTGKDLSDFLRRAPRNKRVVLARNHALFDQLANQNRPQVLIEAHVRQRHRAKLSRRLVELRELVDVCGG